jgi:thiamine biosynthesis lipoprotein
VLAAAERVSALSGGAFDVTVAPLIDAWGFGPRQSLLATPSDAEIAAARAAVGYRRLAIDASRGTVARMHPGIRCDLSAIAPGYAADRVAEALAALGHRNVLVDIGGEIKALGRRPDGTAWRVGIASPTASATADDLASMPVSATVALADDLSLATSGDYRNFFVDAAGVRRSHVIDPRTGRPVSHGLASVTVVTRRAIDADAFATALMVLGPVEGWALATREHLAAQFIVRRDARRFETRQTPAFTAMRAR